MSEHHVVATKFKDKESLVESIKEMGYNPIVHASNKTMEMYGRETAKASIIIPRKQIGAYYADIGFEETDKEFIMHVDSYGDFSYDKLKQGYSKVRIIKQVRAKHKYQLKSEHVEKDGRIKLKVRIR
jgi:hypothetical protein